LLQDFQGIQTPLQADLEEVDIRHNQQEAAQEAVHVVAVLQDLLKYNNNKPQLKMMLQCKEDCHNLNVEAQDLKEEDCHNHSVEVVHNKVLNVVEWLNQDHNVEVLNKHQDLKEEDCHNQVNNAVDCRSLFLELNLLLQSQLNLLALLCMIMTLKLQTNLDSRQVLR
jgi:hypothetical protein